jgi:hypothetical protein
VAPGRVREARAGDPRDLIRAIDAREIPRVATPLGQEQLGELLIAAHRQLYGVAPGPERLLTAWSQVSLETGRGERCINNNVGNVVVSLDWLGPHYALRVHERVERNPDRWREQSVRFRAYPTPLEGAVDYWRTVSGSFGSQLPHFDAGRAREAGLGLCRSGYSTADCDTYAAGIAGLYAWLRGKYLHQLKDMAARSAAPSAADAMTPALWAEQERRTGSAYCDVLSAPR